MAKTASRKAPASRKKAVPAVPKKSAASSPKKKPSPAKAVKAAKKRTPLESSLREPAAPETSVSFSAEESPPGMKALPAGEPQGAAFPFEIDPKRIEEGLQKLRQEVVHWANKGRYTKVRFKFRGKQLLPDLPIAAVAAAEGLTFYWGGILRALIFTVAGGSLLQVELVNDADKRVQAGKEALLNGDLDEALALFREALTMDRDNAGAHLNVGVALKLKGEREAALAAFERAKALDPEGPLGAEAERLAAPLRPKDTVAQTG
ncbi:tetratricopeptide repeat protein [Melittangium boletus]|uniref:Tetratricopeptide repeat protein n=1 Tax=Melittangium boletus DSM 14713 TaxID=1294270 RepID=A0A250IHV4_9BACT|nr:tetratricopeptide repeat protein [Melittangium boletus]ATB30741.1 tetratricopeptide repeat protein [Melittangium boletus DSM 14713]